MPAIGARIVIAPDKFKGSLDAAAVAAALAAGIRDVWGAAPHITIVPMADGGEGTVEAFLVSGARAEEVQVRGPLGDSIAATYARDGGTAIIEMASASGLALLGARLDARRATTYGTGELLRHAIDRGATRIVLGIGGSATSDGGAGALAALGVRFLDAHDAVLEPHPEALAHLARIDTTELDPRVARTDIAIACDVDNPLLGANGAAAIYGPQKGATPQDVAFLNAMLVRFADLASQTTGRDLRALPGAGASGGLGWGLATFGGAHLAPGFSLIAEVRGLAAELATATLVLTGEGSIDEQTLRGKVVAGVAALAHPLGIPVIAFGGNVDPLVEASLAERGVVCVPIASGPMRLETAMRDASHLLRAAAGRAARLAGVR